MIIVVRHAQSQGNADKTLFETTPDHKFELTDTGVQQATAAAEAIHATVGTNWCVMYSSPYPRARQTADIIHGKLSNVNHKIIEDARLRERLMGHPTPLSEMDDIMKRRRQFGKFHFPFPDGESGLQVYDRAASFMDYLLAIQHKSAIKHTIIVTHSYTMRIILMYMLSMTIDEFETLADPHNADWVMFEPSLFDLSRYHDNSQGLIKGSYYPFKST